MTTTQIDDCQSNGANKLFPADSLRLPLDSRMCILFTGHFNGFGVEVRSENEVSLLYHMGCFGKGSTSRSRPKSPQNNDGPLIMRSRQFLKRNYWYKKFGGTKENSKADLLLKEIDELTTKIVSDSEKQLKDVIDLVSSDDESSQVSDCDNNLSTVHSNTEESVVIVPNSDSEEDNYFANLKPKCCINKIKMQEKLMLTMQEAFFLSYGLGCLQIYNNNKALTIEQCWELFKETDEKFILKYVVYHYFRSKGYIVKPGIKFGGDYLLYKEGPGISHADFIVVIRNQANDLDWTSILGHIRMGTTTVKEILIVEVINCKEEQVKSIEDLKLCTIKELILNRKIPVTINEDAD